MQRVDPLPRFGIELVELTELDRIGRTRLRTRGLEAAFHAVVAQRALVGLAVFEAEIDDAERTRGNAVTAAVADVVLHDDGIELGAENRARRTRFETRRVAAMLADVAHHEPVTLERLHRVDALAVFAHTLDEFHMSPRVRRELARVVVAHARQPQPVGGQVVPLLARDLARFAADAQRRVGEEAVAFAGPYANACGELRFIVDRF